MGRTWWPDGANLLRVPSPLPCSLRQTKPPPSPPHSHRGARWTLSPALAISPHQATPPNPWGRSRAPSSSSKRGRSRARGWEWGWGPPLMGVDLPRPNLHPRRQHRRPHHSSSSSSRLSPTTTLDSPQDLVSLEDGRIGEREVVVSINPPLQFYQSTSFNLDSLKILIQWNLFITRSLGPWKLPCYIRFLIISG